MSIASVRFQNSVPVLGTSLRLEQFDASSGWTITLDGADVLLYRAAIVSQNVTEVPRFRVVGAPYCVPAAPELVAEKLMASVTPMPKTKRAKR